MYQDGEGRFVHDGMAALARTPVLPRATPVCAVSAQLRRPRPLSATSAKRRSPPFECWRRTSPLVGLSRPATGSPLMALQTEPCEGCSCWTFLCGTDRLLWKGIGLTSFTSGMGTVAT
jgi:hypothetical protein